jgi:hypothetical protein
MVTRLAVVVLILGLVPSSAFAQSLRHAAKQEGIRLAQNQRPTTARGDNPYETPAIILISGGTLLSVLALVAPAGINCDNDLNCETTGHKGLLVAGLGMAGVGVGLFMKGERQRSPDIALLPGGVYVGKRVKF